MAIEENPAPRRTIATVVATAAVTLAIGVTVAAVGGYLTPAGGGRPEPRAAADPTPPTTRSTEPGGSSSIVLVPITRDSRVEPPRTMSARPDTEVLLAAYERTEHHGEDDDNDQHRDRKHRELDDEGENDDP